MTHRRSEASSTQLCITIRFVLLAISFLQYDLICPKDNECMTHRRSEASSMQLCITIRFVLLAISFLQYDLICPKDNV